MRHLATTVILAFAVLSCSQFTVRTRQDPSYDFAALGTFAWLPVSEAAPADQRVQDRAVAARLRTDVESELRAKGYTSSEDAERADFLVNWRITSTPMSAQRGDPRDVAWGTGWWTGWQGGAAIYSESYDTGTLFLAILDRRSKRIVWLGAAEARLLPHVSLERRLGRVDSAVHDILADFPRR